MAIHALRFLVLILFISFVQCRILRLNSSDDLISDGVDRIDNQSSILYANVSISSTNTCEHQYGFLPCAENAGGYIFQILIYQGLIMFGEKELTAGSRVLFNILGASNIVGIIFRILVGLPAILIMIVSGVFSSKEEAQSKVSLGVGIYAGITVFTLTLQWGVCVIFGRRKLAEQSTSSHAEVAQTSSNCLLAKEVITELKDTGVTIDEETRRIAGIMLLSLIPYTIIQLVDIFKISFETHVVILILLILSSAMLLLYFVYQVMNPWMQQKSLAYTKYETLRTGFLQHMQRHGKLIDEHGELNVPVIQTLFDEADNDANNTITKDEIESLMHDLINKGEMNVDKQFAVSELMKVFDFNHDGSINHQEFANGCKKWFIETKKPTKIDDNSSSIPKIVNEKVVHGESLVWTFIKSILQVLLGIVAMTCLGEPLTTNILQLSHSMNVPSFAISFVVVPLAMNCRAAIAAISPASHKSEKSASLTFSEIYGEVVMSNISNLTALLAIVYAKDLTWDYSAEVLTVLVVCAIVGILAYSRDSYPLWTCLLAFFLYPFSLGLFYYAQFALRWN
ncbi:sodium/calcium exchanger NCL2-like [Olea europaea var. sylvestris]|uniref:sodium/calcium exchanger NCL2-like n=1 Tax=Olea europaea var. sylvestris TaxID=158386 RepID=UPI000C1CE454|nr:sodium/calcium exchanger NCL2-like [Olea europaea var. sylvestris]